MTFDFWPLITCVLGADPSLSSGWGSFSQPTSIESRTNRESLNPKVNIGVKGGEAPAISSLLLFTEEK